MACESSSYMLPSIREMLPGYFHPDDRATPTCSNVSGASSQSNHDELRADDEVRDSDTRKANFRYVCSTCNKRFRRPSSLRVHLVCHTKEKPHKCEHPDCEKHFSTRSNMIRHARKHHWKFRQPLPEVNRRGTSMTVPTDVNDNESSLSTPALAGPRAKISLFSSLTLPPLPDQPAFSRYS